MTELTLRTLKDGSALGYPFYPDGIPEMLKHDEAIEGDDKNVKCWIVCELRQADGKLDKPPMPGFKPKDASTWLSLKDAVKYAHEMYKTGRYDGCYPACIIPQGFIVVDLDNHTGVDNAELDNLYNAIIKPFRGGFIERSISGRGWHITGQAVWDLAYSLTAKSDDGIDIQIRQPEGYILLTGNLHESGQPQIVNIESFLPVLHEYFKSSLIPDFDLDDAELTMEEGEILSRIVESYPALNVQMNTPLHEGPTASAGEFADPDHSNRLAACVRNVYDICRNFEQTYELLIKCPVGCFEGRSPNKQANRAYNTPEKYYAFLRKDWKGICAKVEAGKADFSDVELCLDPQKEWGPKDRTAELPENEEREYLSPYTFYRAAPDNMKMVLDHLTGDNPKKRDMMMDYAIAAALTMAGLATGKTRTVNYDGYENYIQPALVVLGASGTGKSTTTSFISRVRSKAVAFNRPSLMNKKTEQTTHPRNISNYLDEMTLNPHRGFILNFDEASVLFNAVKTVNHTDFQQYLLSALMERKKGGFLAGQQRAKAENNTKPITEPCFGILAAGVQETLMKIIDRAQIVDGTVSRFLFIPDSGMTMQARSKEEIMADRISGARKSDVPDAIMVLYEQMAGKGTPQPEVDVNIPFESINDYVDYAHQIEMFIEKYQQDEVLASFFRRFGLHWSHLVGCLAMYENPENPVISRQHCDWAFKYVLRCIQGMTRKLTSFATDAVDESEVARNILAVAEGVIKVYGRNQDFDAVRQDYPHYVKKGKGPGFTAAHLNAKAFAESVFTANASKFVGPDQRGNKKAAVIEALNMLCAEGAFEKVSLAFGGRPGTFYVLK